MGSRFSCPQCGKQYSITPAIAGKRAKCSCGALVAVPPASPPAEDDILAFADESTAASPPRSATTMPVATVPAPMQPSTAPLAYRNPEADRPKKVDPDVYVDSFRDIHFPVAVLAIGFIGMLAWTIANVDASALVVGIVSVATVISTAVKCAILIGLAIMFAPQLGISFGGLYTAILKFCAIIIFTDAASLWFYAILENMGASPAGYISFRIIGLNLLLTGAFISGFCYYAFDMDGEETGMFAIPMALLSRFIGFLLLLATGTILEALTAPAAPAAGAVPPTPAALTTAAPVPTIPATARDTQIEDRIGNPRSFIREAREYNERAIKPAQARLVELLYAAGAQTIYFDAGGKLAGPPQLMYIELPAANPNARTKIEEILRQSPVTVTPDPQGPGQYIVVALPGKP